MPLKNLYKRDKSKAKSNKNSEAERATLKERVEESLERNNALRESWDEVRNKKKGNNRELVEPADPNTMSKKERRKQNKRENTFKKQQKEGNSSYTDMLEEEKTNEGRSFP